MSKKKLVIGSVRSRCRNNNMYYFSPSFLVKRCIYLEVDLYNQYKKYDKLVALENIVEEVLLSRCRPRETNLRGRKRINTIFR